MNAAEYLAEQLNGYKGEDIWNEVIWGVEGLDVEKCCEGDGMVVYFLGGERVMYFEQSKTWRPVSE